MLKDEDALPFDFEADLELGLDLDLRDLDAVDTSNMEKRQWNCIS
jgi:hypothetical protein